MLKSLNYKIITKTFKEATIFFLLFALVFSFPLSVLAEEVVLANDGSGAVVSEKTVSNEITPTDISTVTPPDNSTPDTTESVGPDGAPIASDTTEKTEDLAPTENMRSMSMMSAMSTTGTEANPATIFESVKGKLQVEADSVSGALVYRYPVSLPSGRGEVSPNLNLVYNSQKTENNSLIGYGWSLDIPYIERINRKGSEKLYSENYFYSSLSDELRSKNLIDANHGEYGAKIENGDFLKYQFNTDNSWTVINKSGLVYKFGLSADSRQDDPEDASRVFKWMLTEIRDQNDNFIKYEYFKDAGQVYPTKIGYSGNGANTGIYEVEFLREARNDNFSLFNTDFSVETNYRIKEIDLKVSNVLRKKYSLEYITGDNGSRSLLSAITESAINDQGETINLPKEEFSYSKSNLTWEEDTGLNIPAIFGGVFENYNYQDAGTRLFDANGDGLTDVLRAGWEYVGSFINTFSGWAESKGWELPISFRMNNGRVPVLLDINGDNLMDIVYQHPDGHDFNFYQNIKTGWHADQTKNYGVEVGRPLNAEYDDVNGDGLVDLLYTRQYYVGPNFPPGWQKVLLNIGGDWLDNNAWQLPKDLFFSYNDNQSENGVRIADVNSDGLADIIQANHFTGKSYLNKGSKKFWQETQNFLAPRSFSSEILAGHNQPANPVMVDINSDGYLDFISDRMIYLNSGKEWISSSTIGIDETLDLRDRTNIRYADINGDGMMDILYSLRPYTGGSFQAEPISRVFINKSKPADLLEKIILSSGAKTDISYKNTAQFIDNSGNLLNPNLPINLRIVEKIVGNDGSGNLSTSTYEYSGGEYYFKDSFDRRFAGFAKVKKTDPYGNTTISYYHQGNANDPANQEQNDHSSKIGRVYRTEIYDAGGKLYQTQINKWENTDLGNDRNFVKLTQTVEQDFDGQSTHRDKAESYVHDDANGNLIAKTSWGEVNATTDGTFTDIGDDKLIANYSYAINSAKNILGLVSEETVLDSKTARQQDNRYYYDGLALGQVDKGNLTKEEKWINNNDYASYQKEYNNYGLVTKEIDPNGNATQYTYDQYNLYPITIKNALGQTTQLEYDYATGQAKKSIDPNGNIIQKEFDGFGRTKSVKQSDAENANTLNLTNSYEYNDTSYPRSVKETKYLNASLSVDSITYLDGFDRIIQTRTRVEGDNQYSVKDTIYNKTGQVEKESLPYFSSGINNTAPTTETKLFVSYEYDALNRPTKIINVLGTTTNQYQNWQTTTTDPLNNQKTLEMDARGNLVKVLEFNGSETYTTKYDYNAQNKLIKITDALNNERNFDYDHLGRLNFQDDLHNPADTTYGMYYFEYDKAGNLIGKADMNGNSIAYTYDVLNRMKTEDNAGTQGIEVNYVYDSCANGIGKLCVASSTPVNTNYEYYVNGLTKKESKLFNQLNQATNTTSFIYDYQGNVLKITYPDNTEVRYEYTTGGQVEKVYKKESTDANEINIVENIDRNPLGQTTLQKLANGVETNYTFDANELYRLKNKTTLRPRSGQASLKLQNLNYTYDLVGNISQIIDSSETNLAKTSVFGYDNLYRLTSATTTNAVMGDNFVQTYQYNAIGNILNKSDIGNYEYKGNTEAKNYANPHATTKVNNKIYTYDKNGNLTSNGEWTHSWDYNNRLLNSTKASSTVSYAYDPTGNRVYKKEGNKESYYINKYYDINDGNVSRYIYLGDQKIATISGQDQNTGCVPPKTGDWNIIASCTMPTSAKAPGSVIINSGAVLTVNASTTLEIDLKLNKLLVKKGGGILVKKGATVRQLTTQPFNQVTIKQLVFHLTDHLTGTNIDTDEQGNVLEAIDYYPFGSVRVDEKSGGYENKYKYTGKELDKETNLNYYGARYYDSAIGRFVSEDPIALFNPEQFLFDPQQLNFYSYGRNNPVLYNDPNGCGAREFAAGFSNAYYTNYTFGFGRNDSSDSSYRMGQALGDGMSLFQGVVEMAAGILLGGGGAFVSGSGVGVAVGVPSIAAGATMVAHGSSLAGSSINNTIKKENNGSNSKKNTSSNNSSNGKSDIFKRTAEHAQKHYPNLSESQIENLARQTQTNADTVIKIGGKTPKTYYYNSQTNDLFINNTKQPTIFQPKDGMNYLKDAVSNDVKRGGVIE